MSINLKSREEMRILSGGLLRHIGIFRDQLKRSKTYRRIEGRVGEFGGVNGAGFDDLFVCWLMFRMWVANKVAFAIQYGENVNMREGLSGIEPCDIELPFLSEGLRDLERNIYTNGGQYWLDDDWHNLFELIAGRIREEAELSQVGGSV